MSVEYLYVSFLSKRSRHVCVFYGRFTPFTDLSWLCEIAATAKFRSEAIDVDSKPTLPYSALAQEYGSREVRSQILYAQHKRNGQALLEDVE